MKEIGILFTVLSLLVGPATAVFAHGDHKMVCKKDGKVIKAKGKTEADKKAKCEEKGGKWEEGEEEHDKGASE